MSKILRHEEENADGATNESWQRLHQLSARNGIKPAQSLNLTNDAIEADAMQSSLGGNMADWLAHTHLKSATGEEDQTAAAAGETLVSSWLTNSSSEKRNVAGSAASTSCAGRSDQFNATPDRPAKERLPETVLDLTPSSSALEQDAIGRTELSEPAKKELLRVHMTRRGHIARSIATAGAELESDETQLVEEWECSETDSLLYSEPSQQPDALAPRGESSTGTGSGNPTVPLAGFGRSSLRSGTPTLQLTAVSVDACDNHSSTKTSVPAPGTSLPGAESKDNTAQEGQQAKTTSSKSTYKKVPGAPDFNSRHNPYRHYSETALSLLAQNPATAATTLYWLCLHHSADIRGAVARNPNCPAESLTILCRDHEAGIRHSVAENPRSTSAILETLAGDKNPLIAWRAQTHLSQTKGRRTVTDLRPIISKTVQQPSSVQPSLPYSEELSATEETISFLRLIARRTNTPPRRLAELARHPDARVRAAVAENGNTPIELLWHLAKDATQEVKLRITENCNCPIEVLEALKDDSDSYVSWQARAVINRITQRSNVTGGVMDNLRTSLRRGVSSRELT